MSGFSEGDINLENLFQPAWAQEKPEKNRYENFSGEDADKSRHDKRRGGFSNNRGDSRPRFPKKPGDRRDSRRPDRRDQGRPEPRERYEAPAPLPEISVAFSADEKGVEHIARQIRMTGRAYPLFQIANLVLQKPERYSVRLAVKKKADGTVAQPLFVCALDDSPWLSEDEAVAHVLRNHFATFYQAERTATEPPKGTYTFVAQCGMSGAILGPPNNHDYQNQLRKLHTERFSRMPFDAFKSRVKIVRDETVVKKWIEDQSFKTEYVCLNVPEPLKLPSMEEVEKHFRATHKESIIKPADQLVVEGAKSRNLRSRELLRLIRTEWEQQIRFPLQLAMSLSKQFSSHGLQFFKVNKTAVHVSVARPQFLDLETIPVSDNVKRIVEFINAHPRCTRRKLIEGIAPSPKVEAPAPAPVAEGEAAAQPAAPKPAEPTPEQTALIADLHWLIHQGHVLEFSDGRMETAKKPLPRPPKPEKKPADQTAAPVAATAETGAEAPVPTEAELAEDAKTAGEARPAEEASAEATAPEPVQAESAPAEAVPAQTPETPAV